MPYPRPFLRLVASGTLYTVEGWSYSLSLIPTGTASSPPTAVPQAVTDALSTFHSATSAAGAKLMMCKLNEIGVDGKYTRPTTVFVDYGPSGFNGSGTVYQAPQVSIAVSLLSDINRGLASKGRFYIAAPKEAPSSSGLLTTTQQTNVRVAVEALLNSLNAAVPGYKVGIASDTREGAMRSVRRVAVGAALDTIRSRRTDIPENKVPGGALSSYEALAYGAGPPAVIAA